MSGLTAIFRTDDPGWDEQSILKSINPLGNFVSKCWHSPTEILATSYPPRAPSGHSRFYQDKNCVGIFAGDIINAAELNWGKIGRSLADSTELRSTLRALKGAFALVVFDLRQQVLWVATDSFGFYPLYFRVEHGAACFSTSISSFLQATDTRPKCADNWIYQFLFFNYPVGNVSPVENVHRIRAGMLGKFEVKTGRLDWIEHTGHVSCNRTTLTGQAAIDKSISVFESVVPEWFKIDGSVFFGLSRGLDSRTLLAVLPVSVRSGIESFTYGIDGSTEIVESRKIASKLDIPHNEVFLNNKFLDQLPMLVHDTVFLSDGQQIVNRAHLPYVYGSLKRDGHACSAIITGVSGDHLFRDHITAWGNVPYLISADMASMFRGGRKRLDRKFYSNIFAARFPMFEEQIEAALCSLETTYGDFTDPESYFRYLMYVAGCRYFGGQAAIANTYSSFRMPYWDPELIQLALDIDLSTVGFSKKLGKKDLYREALLQASVVARNPAFRDIPYLNLPIDVFAKDNWANFQLHRWKRKFQTIRHKRKLITEENWPQWYRTTMSKETERLLGKNSAISEYVSDEFIKQQMAETNIHWLGKLLTAEIVLRLVDNGWKRQQP